MWAWTIQAKMHLWLEREIADMVRRPPRQVFNVR